MDLRIGSGRVRIRSLSAPTCRPNRSARRTPSAGGAAATPSTTCASPGLRLCACPLRSSPANWFDSTKNFELLWVDLWVGQWFFVQFCTYRFTRNRIVPVVVCSLSSIYILLISKWCVVNPANDRWLDLYCSESWLTVIEVTTFVACRV